MGLDTYASRTQDDISLTEEDQAAFEAAAIELCGGMYSGDATSFRGKVYSTIIMEATDMSIYQEWTPPDEVKELSEKLDRYTPAQLHAISESVEISPDYVTSAEECANLQKFLRLCAERGIGLIGWY